MWQPGTHPGMQRIAEPGAPAWFELWTRDKEGPVQVAGGGRYDSMMEMLGAKQPVSAVGCAIRTERVLAAAGGA